MLKSVNGTGAAPFGTNGHVPGARTTTRGGDLAVSIFVTLLDGSEVLGLGSRAVDERPYR